MKNYMTYLAKNLPSVCAALSILAMLLPWISYTGANILYSETESVSAFDAVFNGTASFLGYLMFLCPIILIVANSVKKLKKYNKILCVALPAVGAVCEIAAFIACKTTISGMSDGINTYTSSVSIGFFAVLLTFALTAVAGMMKYRGLKLDKESLNKIKQKGAAAAQSIKDAAAQVAESDNEEQNSTQKSNDSDA